MKITAYEAQVLIGTSISGCNMAPDRTFDLEAAWAKLYALGLIDRTDGLAVATHSGAALISELLASRLAIQAPDGWKPVSDCHLAKTHDEDPEQVLLGSVDGERAIGVVYLRKDGTKRGVAGMFTGYVWTHWQPLPAAPNLGATK